MEKGGQDTTDERTRIHWAAANGDVAAVKRYLEEGDDPNIPDEEGWTPMISAASSGQVQAVAALIEGGADMSLKTKTGHDAFFYAVAKCNMPMTDLFFINEYSNFKSDKYGMNCIHRAVSNPKCTPEFLQMLKNNGAPLKTPDADGNTLMHLACYENRPELIKWLKENAGCSLEYPLNNDKKAPKELITAEFSM
jgi:26S proteasome non-ATPase regulatory subunit 10